MRLKIPLLFLTAFLLGALALVLIIRNPGQWRWAGAFSSFVSGKPAQQGAETPEPGQNTPGISMPSQAGGMRVPPGFLQDFGVLTAVAERGTIPVDIRTVGILAYNDQKIVSINTKFEGWIQKAYVNYIGQPVNAGEPLFEIYSPELVSTQEEYLSALNFAQKMAGNADPQIREQAKSLLDAAGQRLRLWDISANQIADLAKNKKANTTLQIVSPVTGIVISKLSDSLNGTKLSPGADVYKVADLSTLWVLINVYEYQVRFLRLGQSANITLNAFPGRRWMGKIVYLDPSLNQQTRTLAAKVEVPNPDGKLRPDMYANVAISVPEASGVRIPSQAILHTGQRNVVILQRSRGMFDPREVQIGASGGGYTEIQSGLQAGDVVVTSSQFLIDSESNLAAAMAAMPGMQMGPAPPKPESEKSNGSQKLPQQNPGGMEGMEMGSPQRPGANSERHPTH